MKTKTIPSLIMLLAGAVAAIAMFARRYELRTFLTVLLAVLVIAYIAGLVIRKILDKFVTPVLKEPEEGEVIEKDAVGKEDGEQAEQAQTGREAEKTKEE